MKLKYFMVLALTVVLLPMSAQAQWWQRHPAYLHAMSDLRTAYWTIAHHDSMDPAVNDEERHAMMEIRSAYAELKDAAIVDDKDIDAQPPADMTFGDRRGRLHHALDLLHDAHDRVEGEEEDPAARGLRHRAGKHIDSAIHALDNAISFWHF